MIIPVQIYNFYLRKGKTREENISFVRNKTTDHSLPTEQWKTKISLNCNLDGAPDKPCGVGCADVNPKLLLNDT